MWFYSQASVKQWLALLCSFSDPTLNLRVSCFVACSVGGRSQAGAGLGLVDYGDED